MPAHRAAVVDQQAERPARRRPAAGHQLVGARRPPAGHLKGQVEVEVAVSPGPAGAEPPVAAAGARPEPAGADEQAGGEPPGLRAQLRVGGRAEVGQQRDGRVGIRAQQVVEGGLVEPADRGRDLLELPVRPGQLVAAQRPPGTFLDDRLGRRAAQ
jgi:hypothetical protein